VTLRVAQPPAAGLVCLLVIYIFISTLFFPEYGFFYKNKPSLSKGGKKAKLSGRDCQRKQTRNKYTNCFHSPQLAQTMFVRQRRNGYISGEMTFMVFRSKSKPFRRAQDKFSQTRRLANRRQARTIQYVTDDDEANNNVCGNSDKQYAQDKFS